MFRFIAFIGLQLFLYTCSNNTVKEKTVDNVTAKDSVILKPKYSNQFVITKHGNQIGVFIGITAKDTSQKIYLNANSETKIACLSSTILGYLTKLGCEKNIVAIDNKNYVSNSIVLQNINAKKCSEIAVSGDLNIEATVQINPTIIFSNQTTNKSFDKLKSISPNTTFINCLDYLETSPLAKAEWIKLFGYIFNRQNKADSIFESVEKKYLALCKLTDTCKTKPTVFTQLSYGDTWYCPGGKSYVSCLLKNAGANYVFSNNSKTGSEPYSFEKVFTTCNKTQYWIDLFNCNSKKEILDLDKKYENFYAFKSGNLYNNNAKQISLGANPIYENGVMEPDIILSDLIRIFHPEILPNHQLIYYKQIK